MGPREKESKNGLAHKEFTVLGMKAMKLVAENNGVKGQKGKCICSHGK